MAFMIDQADNVSTQLEKFRHAYAFIVVGQWANLDFWLGEAEHALAAIEGYKVRFERMTQAQKDWIEQHDTKVGSYCRICQSSCELEAKLRRPNRPRRIASADLEVTVRRLRNAVYYFLIRCYSLELLDETALRAACERVDTSVDPTDLD